MPDVEDPLSGHRPLLLAEHTTIRLGGPASRLVWAYEEATVLDAVRSADAAGTPLLILGGGSNLVVSDDGFAGTVVRVATSGLTFERHGEEVLVRVAAGEVWDDVVTAALSSKLAGLEFLSGIPGLAGATPIQNVGAYGAEIASLIVGVRAFDRTADRIVELSADQCRFGYRTSALKHSARYVVLDVMLALRTSTRSTPIGYAELATALGVQTGESASTVDVRAAVLALRAAKGMLIDPADPDSVSVGSFFTNPVLPTDRVPTGSPAWPAGDGLVKTSAAWLIENAGFPRGFGTGPVGVSAKHTLALVNRGGATTSELLALARQIRDGVRDRFGVTLEVEPSLVGVSV